MKTKRLKTPHENGPCKVSYGSIYGYSGCMIEQPISIIIDIPEDENDVITVHKYGTQSQLQPTYDRIQSQYRKNGFDNIADNLVLITFNAISGFADYDKMTNAKFTTDEICTIINWLNNTIYAKSFHAFTQLDEPAMHARLRELAEFGF